ncbi:Aspartic proteinase CDR1 [Capsicum annuum]|uniref:Aspartic proteinase CDR1 n=1 Tax=Capsicum annuum TaxID=4072 RepID=A0A2G2Y3L5_CAPAN|nr:Aspartic proteinase CDR1 [Capsicum annuum]
MKLSIGTPPVEIVAIADTGSDLTWTQCQPCINCFQQSYPLFDSKKSSTYKTIGCDAQECTSIGSSSSCVSGNNVCEYQINYGDNSHTIGDLAFDVFTFHSTSSENVAIPNVAFGCGHDNGGTFNNHTSGIIGLGGGEVSIIKQLDKQINGKFSYCLIPIQLDSTSISNVTSHINFGSNAIVSGPDVVSTPLIRMESSTFYYLTLEGVSVGNKTLEFKSSKIGGSYAGGDEGNIIIDSGTTLTLMPSEFYENLESMLVDSINATRKEDSSGTFGLCYDSDENGTIDAPTIVAHFTNADLELSPSSTFAQVEKGLVCLTIVPAKEFAIFGNLAQANFLIGVNGFTLDLIHRDFPLSPFYNLSSTPFERLQNAFHRSFSRANSFFKGNSVNEIQSIITPIPGEYLMKISIGTPPVEIVAIADTGSDLTWTQCKPCILCFQQSRSLFDSNKSSTYTTMSCKDKECTSIGSFSYCGDGNICEYRISYAGQSRTFGDLAFDKFTLPSTSGKNVVIPNVAFGCGHENAGTFSKYTSGNIIIDSGTTFTLLPSDFYSNLESTLVDLINATRKDDPLGTYGLCYESKDGTIDAPKIVAHFTNADLELSPSNTFAQVQKGLVCLTIAPTDDIAIFGNLAQANFLIGEVEPFEERPGVIEDPSYSDVIIKGELDQEVQEVVCLNALSDNNQGVNIILVSGTVKNRALNLLIDSGSTYSFLDKNRCDMVLGNDWMKKHNPTKFDHEKKCGIKSNKLVLKEIVEKGKLNMITSGTMNKMLKTGQTHIARLFMMSTNDNITQELVNDAILKVEYLGHVINGDGASTDPDKIKAMVEWPTPKSLKALRRFLGLTGCEVYRRNKDDNATYPGLLQPLPIPNQSWSQISMTLLKDFLNLEAKRPTRREPWLTVADWWYNTILHTSLKCTSFEGLYEYSPLHLSMGPLIKTNVPVAEDIVLKRQQMYQLLKDNLSKAQDRIKHYADKRR